MLPNTKQRDIMDISINRQNSGEYKLKRDNRLLGVDDVLFDLLSDENGQVSLNQLWADIKSTGLRCNDPRLKQSWNKFQEIERKNASEDGTSVTVDRRTFKKCTEENLSLIIKAFKRDLVIPEFSSFTKDVESICEKCKGNMRGKIADYIPQLARVSPDLWAVSVCTVDGQRYSYGDCDVHFCIQAVSKPLSYALATSDVGAAHVHGYVGQEPSGGAFNKLTLNHNDQPHNPLINSGAIVTNSLIKPKLRIADRFDFVFSEYKRMAGNEYVGFSNSTYLSEKSTADRNFALGYYMRERSCFPSGTDLIKTLEFYFQMCSIETTTESACVIAATLAHGGICPITGEKVLAPEAVRNTLALMHSCGMNDYSGQFAFKVGLPAKSGVAGAVLLVVPNVMGICCYSPLLDSTGNSCRGVQFCEEFVNVFNFHNYDYLMNPADKLDPRMRKGDKEANNVFNLMFSAAAGDVTAVRRFARSGMDMEATDYDSRTALHVAAAEGHLNVITALLEQCKVDVNPRDRWGHTPYDEAVQFGHDDIAAYIENFQSTTNWLRKKGTKNTSEKSSSGYSSKSASPDPENDKW